MEIGDSVTSIGGSAFRQTAITSITIPNSVTEKIGSNAFQGCNNLDIVYMSDSVRSTFELTFGPGQSFFGRTTEIINVNANVIFRGSSDNVLHRAEVNGDLTSDSYDEITKTDIVSVEITGSNVTSIGQAALMRCSSLASVTIGNSVLSIGGNAFRETAITSITIPDSVTSINNFAFLRC